MIEASRSDMYDVVDLGRVWRGIFSLLPLPIRHLV